MASSYTDGDDGDLTPWWKWPAPAAKPAPFFFPGGVQLLPRAYLSKDAPELTDSFGESLLGKAAHEARAGTLTAAGELPLFSLEEAWAAITPDRTKTAPLTKLATDARDSVGFFAQKAGRPDGGGIVRVSKSVPNLSLSGKPVGRAGGVKERVFVDGVTVIRMVFSKFGTEAMRVAATHRRGAGPPA